VSSGMAKQSTAKVVINIMIFEKLYMSGLTDGEMAKEVGCGKTRLQEERVALEWPSNQGLFGWQKKLRRSEFERIPSKYRREVFA